jgi:hypothetical protein
MMNKKGITTFGQVGGAILVLVLVVVVMIAFYPKIAGGGDVPDKILKCGSVGQEGECIAEGDDCPSDVKIEDFGGCPPENESEKRFCCIESTE